MARTSEDTDLEVDLRDGIGMSLLTEATRLRFIMKDGLSMIERGFEEMTKELRIVKEQIFNQRMDLEDWVEEMRYKSEEESETESDKESEQESDKEMGEENELEELAKEIVEAEKKLAESKKLAEAKKSEGEKGEEMNGKDDEEEKGTENRENGEGSMTQK